MLVRTASDHRRRTYQETPVTVMTLAVVLSLLAAGAIQGGVAMVTNPIDPLGMSPAFLDRTPVDDYFLPGVFLLAIAAASLLTVPGLVLRWRWRWAGVVERAVGFRWPWVASVAIGALLLAFELTELVFVPFHPVMHPLLIGVSLAVLALPFSRSARAFLHS